MKAKERGYVLAIDQASNAAGCSLWYDGKLLGTRTLRSHKSTDTIGKRLVTQVAQLDAWLKTLNLMHGDIKTVVFEGVRARLVLVTTGAFLCSPYIDAKISPTGSFVESTSWKKYAERRGAQGTFKEIKGLKALTEIGFPVGDYLLDSDDICDSILIYMTWRDRI